LRKALALILLFLIAFVVGIMAGDNQPTTHATTLSLSEVVLSQGEIVFSVEGSPDARYLRKKVGLAYDGYAWHLQKITEVYKLIDASLVNGSPVSPNAQFLSRNYRDFNRDLLNEAYTADDPRCLDLSGNISDRVKELSLQITKNMKTPFEKAKAIETYIRVRYEYNLDFTPAPPGWEPNDWFLFESEEGICANFNSAFVILARASGIPARLATGYYLPPGNEEPQPVYSYQAHAWAEVGFEEIGWIAFEATPS